MANQILNLNPSDTLTINIKRGQAIDIDIDCFEQDNITPHIIEGVVLMGLSRSLDKDGLITTLISGGGLSILSNRITIQIRAALWLLLLPDAVYFDIKNIISVSDTGYLTSGVFLIDKNISE